LRVFTYLHKFGDFKQALISSAAVELWNDWQRLAKIAGQQNHRTSKEVLSASNARLCAIVHSSQMIILQFCSAFTNADFLAILHVGSSIVCKFSDSLSAK